MFNVAIFGAGGMAGMHARGYAALPNARLVGVLDAREEAAHKLGDAHEAPGYTDLDRLVAEAKPNVIDVCVPTPFHAEYVIRAAGLQPRLRGIVVEAARSITGSSHRLSLRGAALAHEDNPAAQAVGAASVRRRGRYFRLK